MKFILAIFMLLFVVSAHAQGYSDIINDPATQKKLLKMTKGLTPEADVSVLCGNMKAFVDFGKVEFTRYSESRLTEKFVCGMENNQRTCFQDDLSGKLTWIACEESCPPADWHVDACPLKPAMEKAMYGRILTPEAAQ